MTEAIFAAVRELRAARGLLAKAGTIVDATSVATTHAAVADIQQLPQLLHGEEAALYGDKAYRSEGDRQACEATGMAYRVNRRATKEHPVLTAGV